MIYSDTRYAFATCREPDQVTEPRKVTSEASLPSISPAFQTKMWGNQKSRSQISGWDIAFNSSCTGKS